MIQIKMRDSVWMLDIRDEIWQFEDEKKLFEILGYLVKFKRMHGQLRPPEKRGVQDVKADSKAAASEAANA